MQAGLKLLVVAAGVYRISNVVVVEDREVGRRVADHVVGCLQCLQPDEIVRSIGQRRVGDIGDGTLAAQPHVRSPSQKTGADDIVIRFALTVTMQEVLEGVHEAGAVVHKLEHGLDVHVSENLEEGMVDRRPRSWGGQRPAPAPLPPEMLVLARRDTAVDFDQAPFK